MEKRKLARIFAALLAWILTVSWGYFIFSMSAEDSGKSSETSGKVVEKVAGTFVPNYEKLPEKEKNEVKSKLSLPVRKIAHFSEFAVLGALILTSVKLSFYSKFPLPYYLIASILLGVIYATIDELHQGAVSGRSPKFADVLIDSGGVICGVIFVSLVIYLIERKRRRLIS